MKRYSQGAIRKRRKSKRSDEWVWEAVLRVSEDGRSWQKSHVLGVACDPPVEGETRNGKNTAPSGKGARQALRAMREWREGLVEAEAERAAAEVAAIEDEDPIAGMKVVDYLDRYWANRNFDDVTRDGYDNIRKHIDHPVLDIPIRRLTPTIVQSWIDARRKKGDSDNILNKSLNQLKYACRWGVKMQELSANPCDPITPPKRSHRDPNPLSTEDFLDLRRRLEQLRELGATQSSLADAATLALLTGMRIGELCGLSWDDIDGGARGDIKADGHIHVNNVVTAPKGGMRLKPYPKNGSRRDVPMNAEIVRVLVRRRSEMAAVEGGDLSGCYVLAKPESAARHASPDYLGKRWTAFIETTGIKGAEGVIPHFHDLRHTFATQSLINGVDVMTVASILGHRDSTTTLKYYARWMPSANAKAMKKMGDVMSGESERGSVGDLPDDPQALARSLAESASRLDAEQLEKLREILASVA